MRSRLDVESDALIPEVKTDRSSDAIPLASTLHFVFREFANGDDLCHHCRNAILNLTLLHDHKCRLALSLTELGSQRIAPRPTTAARALRPHWHGTSTTSSKQVTTDNLVHNGYGIQRTHIRPQS